MLKKLDVVEGKKNRFLADHVTQVTECKAQDRVMLSFLQQAQAIAKLTTKRSIKTLVLNMIYYVTIRLLRQMFFS